jgi:hypothetical protein
MSQFTKYKFAALIGEDCLSKKHIEEEKKRGGGRSDADERL